MTSDATPPPPRQLGVRCSRCQGWLLPRTDQFGCYLACLTCGHTQAITAARVPIGHRSRTGGTDNAPLTCGQKPARPSVDEPDDAG